MKSLKAYVGDSRGITLIELMVAITVSVIILIPIYNTMLTGQKIQLRAFGQADLQEKSQGVLNQLVGGKGQGAARVGGLRQAMLVKTFPEGLAFIVADTVGSSAYTNVSYYKSAGKIFYNETNVNPNVEPFLKDVGAVSVLENVAAFTAVESNSKKSFKITITTNKPQPGAGTTGVTLSTEVKPRNMR